MSQLLTPKKAAQQANVEQSVLRQAADAGRLPVHFTPGGHRRYALSDLQRHYPAASSGTTGQRLVFQVMAIALEEELAEMFNDPALINDYRGAELADNLQQEIANSPGDLWDWVVANNFQFDALAYIDRPEQALRIGEDPGLSSSRCPAIKISSETVLLFPDALGPEIPCQEVKDLLHSEDLDQDELIAAFRRSGLFATPEVKFYFPESGERRLLQAAYY